ncbi:MAG: nuclear transport factor 2 family protein [Novosphingobium sp.]|nr:nuclear transport factor 2 family protein [Novosphingobium sp.]
MDAVARLAIIADIRQLKARYFLGVDLQDFDLLRREVLHPEVTFQLAEFRKEPYVGADEVLAMFAEGLKGKHSVHHGHMPVIEPISATSARGIWAMEDRIYWGAPDDSFKGALFLHGFGHYHETYVCTDAGWRIRSIRLTRLHLTTNRVF